MSVLARSAPRRKQGTPMNISKVAVRKFVSRFRIFRVSFVDSQMPFRIFPETMPANKLILFL